MGFSEAITSLVDSVQGHLPDILSGISLTTGLASTIYGIAVTPKAMDRFLEWVMENTSEEDRAGFKLSELHQLIPFKMKVRLVWTLYLPVALGCLTSIGTGIAADVMHDQDKMAYAALASALQTRVDDLVESTKEVVGPKKYDEIEAAAAQKTLDRIPEQVKDENVFYVNTKTEGFPVIDNFTQRTYIVDRDSLDKLEDNLNSRLAMEDITINDIFRGLNNLGRGNIRLIAGGENLVYTSANGKFRFVTDMRAGMYEGRPCGVINLLHNLCIRHEHSYIKIDKYA